MVVCCSLTVSLWQVHHDMTEAVRMGSPVSMVSMETVVIATSFAHTLVSPDSLKGISMETNSLGSISDHTLPSVAPPTKLMG